MAEAPPVIIVSISEYMREVRAFRTFKERLRRLYRLWGHYASRWRWYRRREDYEALVRTISEIARVRREEREAREFFRRKVRKPYWRVQLMRMYEAKDKRKTPLFYAEYRVYVFTRHPEKYAIWSEKEMEYVAPQPELEEDLNELEYVISKAAYRKHIRWARKVRKLPADFEAIAVDESEVEWPLDEKRYYVRIIDEDGVEHTYEDKDVKEWLKAYRTEWIPSAVRRGEIKYPERYIKAVRQTTLEEWAEMKET